MAEAKIVLSGENRTKKAFDEVKRSFTDIEGASDGLRNALAGVGAGLSIAGIAAFVSSGINVADDLNKLSQKIGVSVESLSAFRFAAKLSDVSADELSTGMARLARAAAEAQAGTAESAEAFKALDVAVTNSSGQLKSTEELLLDVAEKFSGIEDGAGKTALAMRIFGRSGAELIPLLNQGRSGFQALREEAERLGLIISKDTARAAEQFNDNMTRLGSVIDKLKNEFANSLLPALSKTVQEMLDGQRIAGGFSDALRILGTINPFRDLATNIGEANRKLEELDKLRQRNLSRGKTTFGLDAEIDEQKKRLEFLKLQQRQQALALEGGDSAGERARFFSVGTGLRAAPNLRDGGEDSRKKLNAEIESLGKQADSLGNLLQVDKTRAAIEDGRIKVTSKSDRERLLAAAAAVDAANQEKQIKDQISAINGRIDADEQKRVVNIANEIQRLNEVGVDISGLTNFEKVIRDIESGKLRVVNDIEREQLLKAAARADTVEEEIRLKKEIIEVTERAEQAELRRGEQVKDTKSAMQELGFVASSAFEDAILNTEKFSNVLQGISRDIARVLLRRNVSDPIAQAIGGFDFNSIFSGFSLSPTPLQLSGPFASGGSFNVGGTGGTDSQTVAFRATPGERVTVTRPDQISGGGGSVTVNLINQSGQQLQASSSRESIGSDGSRTIELVVRDAVKSLAGRGELDQMFAQFGARRAPVF